MRIRNAGVAAALFIAAINPVLLPGQAWQQVASPGAMGYDVARIERARELADSVGSGAVMMLHRGRVVAAFGDVSRPFNAHSIRKSLLNGLLGIAEQRGELRLDATLASLQVDDLLGLTASEKEATVADLAAARSGVYHPAAYADQSQDEERPARGSHPHGTNFFYNNWDFNALEQIVERAGRGDLYRLYHERIAQPIGMEDFDPAKAGYEVLEPSRSRIPAHTVWISARDMARYGELIRNGGKWGERQVIPAAWIARSTEAISDVGRGQFYGLLWWGYQANAMGERFPVLSPHRLILGRGTGGQALLIVPDLELVIVHRGDTDNGRSVPGPAVWAIFEQLAAATAGAQSAVPSLVALAPTPLQSQRPMPSPLVPLALNAAERQLLVGDYVLGAETPVRLFEYDDRLFLNAQGLGESELLPISASQLVVRSEPGMVFTVERDATGTVTALSATVGGRLMRAVRK